MRGMSLSGDNLLGGPPPTYLPDDADVRAALAESDPAAVAQRFPAASAPWAELAERALASGDAIAGYAYARTGYHRGLDALRRNGWKGHGPIPYAHEPNRGFLRALAALAKAAGDIGEQDEADRCRDFLRDSDPEAAAALL
jgi:hypothetical protein